MAQTLVIATLNAHSLVRRVVDLQHCMNRNNVDVMCIQETWLNRLISDNVINVPGYSVVRLDRPNQSGYGGVAMYVRETLNFVQLLLGTDESESLWIRITTKSGNVILANIYRPPKNNENAFLSNLERNIANLSNYILVGDFNINGRHQDALTGWIP